MQKKSVIAVAAALALLPGALVGCSAGSGPGAPSSGGSGGPGASAKGAGLASCLRDKGYDMPDPDSGGSTMTFAAPDGVDEEQWGTDLDACLEEAGVGDAAGGAAPIVDREQQRQLARCIRDHGFEDYPDDEQGQQTYEPSDAQALQDAESTCFDEVVGPDAGAGDAE